MANRYYALLSIANLIIGSYGTVAAQQSASTPISSNRDSLYRVEVFAELGPMVSIFTHKRVFPDNVSSVTPGYNAMIRVKWHPDHLLSVGILTGFQHIVSEHYSVVGSTTIKPITGTLTAVPLMVDVSLSKWGFELGAAVGFCIFTTWLTDGPTAIARRWELATVYHGAYYVPIGKGFSFGGELLVGYANYRTILTIAPQAILKYEILSY